MDHKNVSLIAAAPAGSVTPATPNDLFRRLEQLGISTTTVSHLPAFTAEELASHVHSLPGVHVKNLFLCDAKKKMWLVVTPLDRRIDLKRLPDDIGAARLSFGSADRLKRTLGVEPGSVTPFAAINDPHQTVQLILDAWMMEQPILTAHPLVNNMTTTITPADLLRFLEACGHRPRKVDLAGVIPTS
ncbi:MAG: prolyl-tRNA synthetase associated domain-containing protein [Alphaproteobacteria bacterium]|nr:prolyl-tRNA synthetase associated domain-containing protein [Alphaproteobacteria bacterium]